MEEASPHKESARDVPWDRSGEGAGQYGIGAGIRWAQRILWGDGWRSGRLSGRDCLKRLGAGPSGLDGGAMDNLVPTQGVVVEELAG